MALDTTLPPMTPGVIYLVQGEYNGESALVWCDDPAPDSNMDPAESVKYVKADSAPVSKPSRSQHTDSRQIEWRCKDSQRMTIGEMTDAHLVNAHKLISKRIGTPYEKHVDIQYYGYLKAEINRRHCKPDVFGLYSDKVGES